MQHFVRKLTNAAVAGVLVFVLPAPVDVVCGSGSGRSSLLTPVGPPPQNVHIESNGPLLHTLRWDRLPGITGYNQLDEKYLDVSPRQSGAKYRVIALYPDGRQGCADFVYMNPPQFETPAGFSAVQTGPGKVHLSWQLTADYGGAWKGVDLPVASSTLRTIPSGHYLVTVTGLRAVQINRTR